MYRHIQASLRDVEETVCLFDCLFPSFLLSGSSSLFSSLWRSPPHQQAIGSICNLRQFSLLHNNNLLRSTISVPSGIFAALLPVFTTSPLPVSVQSFSQCPLNSNSSQQAARRLHYVYEIPLGLAGLKMITKSQIVKTML